jgi:hypothetical protein
MTLPSEAKLEILADPEALARRVADWLLAAAAKDGVFAVALSDGSTRRRHYKQLAWRGGPACDRRRRSTNLKNMLGQIKANSRDRRQISDRLTNGRRSFRGCSTTTVLTQLFIERDAGAGAVPPITLLKIGCGFFGIRSYNHAAATTSRHVCSPQLR